MSWLLEHFQILLAVAGAVAYWLNQRSEARKHRDGSGDAAPPPLPGWSGADDESNTRRIQDEIRRKIAERQGGGVPPLPDERPVVAEVEPPPPTLAPRPVAREIAGGMRKVWDAKLAEARLREEAAVRERARRLAEQAESEEAERDARARSEAIARLKAAAEAGAAAASAASRRPLEDYLAGLRGQENLRRAMVLREVLGPPVALR